MEHITDLNQHKFSAPVGAIFWDRKEPGERGNLPEQVGYKKTRSTLALDALDLAQLGNERCVDAISYLLRSSRILGRAEIVVECLEVLAERDEKITVLESFNALQHTIICASTKMNMGTLRIALEKRGEHFDVRVYLNSH